MKQHPRTSPGRYRQRTDSLGDIGLRLRHRLMGGASRPEAVAVLAERRVPQRLEPLQHRLLDHAVDRRSMPRSRVPPAGSGFAPDAPVAVGSDPGAVDVRSPASAFQESRKLSDGDAVGAWGSLVAPPSARRF